MALPASEDTRLNHKGWVEKEIVVGYDHIDFTAGADLVAGDFLMLTPYFGLVDRTVANGSAGTLHVGQVYGVGSDRVGTSQTFDTIRQAVFFNPTDSKFYEATADGYIKVGFVARVRNATNGDFAFEGLRFHGDVDPV